MLGPESDKSAVGSQVYGFKVVFASKRPKDSPCVVLLALEFVLARESRPNGLVECSYSKNQVCCLEGFACRKLDSPCSLVKGCRLELRRKVNVLPQVIVIHNVLQVALDFLLRKNMVWPWVSLQVVLVPAKSVEFTRSIAGCVLVFVPVPDTANFRGLFK